MSRNNLIIAAVVLVVLAGGWYLLGSQKNYSPIPTSTVAPQQLETSSPSAIATKNTVTITSLGFEPKVVTIKAGETVTWVNNDSVSHQVNSAVHPTHQVYPPLNKIDLLKPGDKKSLEFPQIGSYKYHDHLNSSLVGTVVVK